MSTTTTQTPTSLLRFGLARVDITPPVGIYHPMWGAARHHRATGVHRPLTAEVMAFGPMGDEGVAMLRVQLDMIGLDKTQHEIFTRAASEGSGVPVERVLVACSHTHSGGLFTPDRQALPGGDLIAPYLDSVEETLRTAAAQAVKTMQEAVISYGRGRCDLAANRDYWDAENGLYACGFNPGATADGTLVDDTLLLARVTDAEGALLATLVNYGCHPTTLAWENTLISPDYVGALRETVETATGAPCVFALGACGDLGPRRSHQGSIEVADQNGRQLGYGALAALAALDPPATDFVYTGPVVSGATLGTWAPQPLTEARRAEAARFEGGRYTVDLPMRARVETATLEAEMNDWLAQQQRADARGDAVQARDFGARAERARRWLMRTAQLPDGDVYPFPFSIFRLGDAFWITTGGEPYSQLQTALRQRFAEQTLLVTPVVGEMLLAYLLPQDLYGQGLYQEEPSILAPGCLEQLVEAVAERVEALLA